MIGGILAISLITGMGLWWIWSVAKKREAMGYERGIKMDSLLIHLPPATDDIEVGSRDERDVIEETLSEAQIMYSIIASTMKKGWRARIYGQEHIAFEIVAVNGLIKYFVHVPEKLTETVRQAIISAYPTAKVEETGEENIFPEMSGFGGVSGGELSLKKPAYYPIANYEMTKRDASLGILNAFAAVREGESAVLQILLRPAENHWKDEATEKVKEIRGEKTKTSGGGIIGRLGYLVSDMTEMLWKPPETHENNKTEKILTNAQQEEMRVIEDKTRHQGFEVLIRVVTSAKVKERSEGLLGGIVAAFAQFEAPNYNGFRYEPARDMKKLTVDYAFRLFPVTNKSTILNTVELTSIFHLPAQNVIPTSKVERQLIKQVDGPAQVVEEGLLLGINEYRGVKKQIRLAENDRRRHLYVIGATGMGKSVLLGNLAYQDMMDGKGFAFVDPHGDVVEDLLSKVPPERVDDVIYFDPSDMENPIGMNMFEFETPDQKDFIIQEGINMLYSLYDPEHTGIFGPRGEHMFRNAALLLMSDPAGASFVDIPKVFIDPKFVRNKLKYVTDRTVYDYWTKEFPAAQQSNDAGEVTTWFVSKWGPFMSNMMMRNILGQTKSGFNLREVMDGRKILLVNLSKGKMGELNSKLLGMIFVMKFQTAAMARADIPEAERVDFSLFVDEFQNFSTESFESILSEARKFRLSLVIANQFMTQLTDKIREGILGNVGTIIAGRVGITDAQMLEKAFLPVFNAEDLHKLPNHYAITTVMMHGMPSSPFTMALVPPMGVGNMGVLAGLKSYSAARYGRPRSVVEAEIDARWSDMAVDEQEGLEGLENVSEGQNAGGAEPEKQTEVRELVRKTEENEMEKTEKSEAKKEQEQKEREKKNSDFLEKWLMEQKKKKKEEGKIEKKAEKNSENKNQNRNTEAKLKIEKKPEKNVEKEGKQELEEGDVLRLR